MPSSGFVHLHVHTEYSLLDGLGKIKDYVKKAKELGMPALAITDHGVGYGLVEFYQECKKQEIKPILGCEFYVAPESRLKKEGSINSDRYYHLILLVKNDIGYKNLCILISRSNTEGYYYKPRIDFELLKDHHEGLVCLSGCVAGEVSQAILRKDFATAEATIDRYHDLFKDDYYLEIQKHGIYDEDVAFGEIIKFAKNKNIKLVCTNDCHYVNSEDAEAHSWLICVQTGKQITDPDRMIYEGDYSLKSEEEMRQLYPNLHDAFDNTIEIADKCNYDFHFAETPADYRMPKVTIPEEFESDYFGYLKHLTYKGLDRRYPKGHVSREQALSNIEKELKVIGDMGFAEYFLDTLKTILWARENNILVGPGRGSGAGSTVNYCIGITNIDPIKYGLLFERFLNPERISMPDIDVDYSYAKKAEVVRSEYESNGADKFSRIQTFGTMKAKNVIRDCCRVAGFSPSLANKFSKLIPADVGMTLSLANEMNPEIKEFIASNDGLDKVWDIALKLEGTKRSASMHACGAIPTPIPCEELYPCSVDKETGYLVCQYNMIEAEHLGNLKKDLLMLRNLTIIESAQEQIEKNTGIKVPLWTEEILNDKDALALIARGDTKGVFQLESDGMASFMKDLKPDCFEDIIAGVSLYRPGPMDYIPKYVTGKHDPTTITYLTPELEPILKPTYGVIVYQEQVMQIVRALAGFSMGRADVVRKAMGKKRQDVMDAESINFIYGNEELKIDGCSKNKIDENIATEIWRQMAEFAKYAFNKSHAAAYAAISMQTAYLKAHYKVEFMMGLLTSVMDSSNSLAKYCVWCKNNDIPILPPDVNHSNVGFSVEDNTIRFGLMAIKKVGENAAAELVKERQVNGEYSSFSDLVRRNPLLNKGALEKLIETGALDFTGNTRSSMITNLETALDRIKKENKGQCEGQLSLFEMFNEDSNLSTDFVFPNIKEYDAQHKLKLEKEACGIYLSGHPLDDYLNMLQKTTNISKSSLEKLENEYGELVYQEGIYNGMDVVFGGIITDFKVIYTKKTNEPMAFVDVEGMDGIISCIVFPKQYQQFKDFLEKDQKILLRGTLSIDDDEKEPSILIDKMESLEQYGKTLYLRFDTMDHYKTVKPNIDSIIQNNSGQNDIILFIKDEKKKSLLSNCIDAKKSVSYFTTLLGDENAIVK